jgi:hypothetical protein
MITVGVETLSRMDVGKPRVVQDAEEAGLEIRFSMFEVDKSGTYSASLVVNQWLQIAETLIFSRERSLT